MKKFLFCVMYTCIYSGNVMASDKCEDLWNSLGTTNTQSADAVLEIWNEKESFCSDSWFFVYKRVSLMIQANRDSVELKKILNHAKLKYSEKSPFEYLLILLEEKDKQSKGPSTQEEIKVFLKRYLALQGTLISTYPEYKSLIASLKLSLLELDDARKLAKEAMEKGEFTGPLITLILANEMSGDYKTAKFYLDRLANVDPDQLKKNKSVLLSAARIYAAEGHFDLTNLSLSYVASLSPLGQSDPDIQKAVSFIKSKIQSGEFKAK